MAVYVGSSLADMYAAPDDEENYLSGLEGDDVLSGGRFLDFIYGGDGNDTITAGLGYGFFYGQAGDDTFVEGDLVWGQSAYDIGSNILLNGGQFYGGDGFDTVDFFTLGLFSPLAISIDLRENALTPEGAPTGNGGLASPYYFDSIERIITSAFTSDGQYRGDDSFNHFVGSGNAFIDARDGFDRYTPLDIYSVFAGDPVLQSVQITFDTDLQDIYVGSLNTDFNEAARQDGEAFVILTYWDDIDNNGIVGTSEEFQRVDRILGFESYEGIFTSDIIILSDADEEVVGTAGNDSLNGGEGFDTLNYENLSGPITAYLDPDAGVVLKPSTISVGSDDVDNVVNFEALIGTQFGDQINGSRTTENTLYGRGGDDFLGGWRLDDVLFGEDGNDILFGGSGDDILEGGTGKDVLDGYLGNDTASFASSRYGVLVSLTTGIGYDLSGPGVGDSAGDTYVGIENLFGSEFSDTLKGDANDNILEGGYGDAADNLYGEGGDDTLFSGVAPFSLVSRATLPAGAEFPSDSDDEEFADALYGGDGNDVLFGDDVGNDYLYGEADDDVIYGFAGIDAIEGGAGDDVIDGGAGFDFILGGEGVDRVAYNFSPEGVVVDLTNAFGSSGGDAQGSFLDLFLNLFLEGDSIQNILAQSFVTEFLLSNPEAESAFAFPDIILGVEDVDGSQFDDRLIGNAAANTLYGDAGNDYIDGGLGSDTLEGGPGDDVFVIDDAGDRVMENADEGFDTVYSTVDLVARGSAWANIELFEISGEARRITGNIGDSTLVGNPLIGNVLKGLTGNDTLIGGVERDLLNGGGGADHLIGGDGADLLDGRNANDLLEGGTGRDELLGGKGDDTLYGDGGRDFLDGGSDDDLLDGGEGDDTLIGGAGQDVLTGGSGADVFTFNEGDMAGTGNNTADRILDFSKAESDIIDLSGLDAIAGGADNAFAFVGNSAFSGSAGEVRWEFRNGNTLVYMDIDGDSSADYAIRLNGEIALSAADFIL